MNELSLGNRGDVTNRNNGFFSQKTIQRAYDFVVYFDLSNIGNGSMASEYQLESYHATSVELPDYTFDKAKYNAGPFVKTFPVLNHDGFEFTIKFEEDAFGSIKQMIQKLVRLNIDSNGYHVNNRIKNIEVGVYGYNASSNYRVSFKDCYFLKASTASYSYGSNEKIEYDITFNADHFEMNDNSFA